MTKPPAYTPLAGHYDEMVDADGALRSHWQAMTNALAAAGRHEMNRRTQETRRLIRDNGMTFHVQKRGGARERPWPLDVIPCVIDGAEWAHLERAVVQRAELYEAVLGDLYGPRQLIRTGALPADWLHANPAFLRPCDGLRPPGGRWLPLYAADLVRAPDGGWRVLGDRTEAPAGLAFALENRIVVNTVLPDVLVASKVRRLAGTFETRRTSLAASAPGHRQNPRIVVLTPGPASENYFEHAFLARYMGYTLVEGTDLTVRDYRVYIKTLGGLQPVDLILRSQPSEACDPLEFGGASQSGVSGLVEAVRRGNVAVINPPGAGVAESPAVMAFLPALCRRLLDAELLLPSVATWWCGDEAARAHVLDHLDELVIKPAYPSARRERTFGRRLPEGRRARLADRIARQPHRYVAQEQIALSTTPVRVAGGLSPRFLVIRVYALSAGDGYDVLPGGLGRVSSSTGSFDVTLLGGGSSKDVWVAGEAAEPHRPLIPAGVSPIAVSRATFDLPSRVADNLYWLGRYAERVDAAVRLLRAAMPLLSEESSRRSTAALTGALSFLTDLGYVPHGAGAANPPPARALQAAISSMLSESEQRGSLRWHVERLRNAAWLLRDRLSADSWRIISRLESDLRSGRSRRRERGGLRRTLDQMVMMLASFSGAVSEGMTRGHGWRLLDFGRRLERALQVIRLLRHGLTTVTGDERARIELLLDATDSVITYRSRYLTSMRVNLVVDLLLLDDANPRGVALQLDHLKQHVAHLPEPPTPGRTSPESKRITAAVAAIQLVDFDELCDVRDGRRHHLTALLDRVQTDLRGLSDALTRDYLTHAAPVRHLARRASPAAPLTAQPTLQESAPFCGADSWPGERRLRLRPPPNQPARESGASGGRRRRSTAADS